MKEPTKIIIHQNIDNSMLTSPDHNSRMKLEDIFHKLAEEKRKKTYGERYHAKFVGGFYRIEYNFWERKTLEDPESAEILEFEDDISDCFFKHTLGCKDQAIQELFFGYSIKTPYFEEQMNFLYELSKKSKNSITDSLMKYDPRGWLQGDEKKTYLHTSFSLTNFDEISPFLKAHIEHTLERH